MSQHNNRREFLKTTAAAGVGFWVAGNALADDQKPRSPNEQINFACIGVGGKGASDSADAGKSGNVVAICDVDDKTLEKAAERFPGAKKYNDFRKMLDEMGKSIDAVTVSTPDHCHAAASAMAMRMGKACFTQKPLTHTLYEARKLAEIAREKKVATQMGNQGTANDTLRKAAALLRAGVVGNVKEVHVWTNRPIWPQGGDRPKEGEVPAHVHWDLWLGPAPYRPYANGYHPFAWRGWWDFGTGALGDMACHTLNMPFQGLDLRDPISVEAETSGHNKDSFPKWSVIRYEFAANGKRGPVTLYWYDGGKKPSQDLFPEGIKVSNTGCYVMGDKDNLFAPGDYCENGHRILGGSAEPEVEIVKSPDHFQEWVRAIRGGEPAMSNFENYAGPLTETVLLGNLAVWAGKKVMWDAKNLKATNAPEVDEVIKTVYRDGYTL
jgi:predicted dehydrogenase